MVCGQPRRRSRPKRGESAWFTWFEYFLSPIEEDAFQNFQKDVLRVNDLRIMSCLLISQVGSLLHMFSLIALRAVHLAGKERVFAFNTFWFPVRWHWVVLEGMCLQMGCCPCNITYAERCILNCTCSNRLASAVCMRFFSRYDS